MNTHHNGCTLNYRLIDSLIKARVAQFLTWDEIRDIQEACQPCVHCSVKPDEVSPMSGRLYSQVWDKVKKQIAEATRHKQQEAAIVDISQPV